MRFEPTVHVREDFMHTRLTPSLLVGALTRFCSSRRNFTAVAITLLILMTSPAFSHSSGTVPQPAAQPLQEAQGTAGTQAETPPAREVGGEAGLKLPDMSSVPFLHGSISGSRLLSAGLIFCALGGIFGLVIYMQLKNLPVHPSMREISEMIYETCKTYLT